MKVLLVVGCGWEGFFNADYVANQLTLRAAKLGLKVVAIEQPTWQPYA